MRSFKTILLPAILLLAFTGYINAQCKAFAKRECLPKLISFTHDGNYHAAILLEGEEAELYKTFYSDMDYRVSIVGDEKLPDIEFRVLDSNKNVLYSNKGKDYAKTWDFKLQSSQQLKFVIKVPSETRSGQKPMSGCVAIMFGFKIKR